MEQAGISVREATLPNFGKPQGSTESANWVAAEPPWEHATTGDSAGQQWHGALAP